MHLTTATLRVNWENLICGPFEIHVKSREWADTLFRMIDGPCYDEQVWRTYAAWFLCVLAARWYLPHPWTHPYSHPSQHLPYPKPSPSSSPVPVIRPPPEWDGWGSYVWVSGIKYRCLFFILLNKIKSLNYNDLFSRTHIDSI